MFDQQSHYALAINNHSQKRWSEAIPPGLNYRSFHAFVNAPARGTPSHSSSTQSLVANRSFVFIHALHSRTRPAASHGGVAAPNLSTSSISTPSLPLPSLSSTTPASPGPSTPPSKG